MYKDMVVVRNPVYVEPFSPELAARFSELVPHGGVLAAAELEELVCSVAAREDLWRPLLIVDPDHRRYELLYEDEHIDVWVLSWMPGQRTGFHDHDCSHVGLVCAQGELEEGLLAIGCTPGVVRLTPHVSRQGPAGYIHAVSHVDGLPAVSIHAYSPPLMRVGQYRIDELDGRLRREPEHGRKELIAGDVELRCPRVDPAGSR